MKKNQYILDMWIREVSTYEKLTIAKAQELYKKFKETEDSELKKSYMDRLIMGTLYILCDYISRNELITLCTSQFDMNDLINSFIESWIKTINEGKLLNVDMFSKLFRSGLFTDVFSNLGCSDVDIYEQFYFNSDIVGDLFLHFVKCKNAGQEFDYDAILDENDSWYDWFKVCNLIPLFEKMYDRLLSNKDESLEIARTKLMLLIKYYISVGLIDRINSNIPEEVLMEDKIIDDIVHQLFLEDVDSVVSSERAKQIIRLKYGLDGEDTHTFHEIADKYKISEMKTKLVEKRARRQLYRSRNIQNYNE